MEFWKEVLNNISENLSKPSFETWLANTTAECKDDVVFVKAKNDFQADWLDSRYKSLISKTVEEVVGKRMEIVITSEESGVEPDQFQKSTARNGYEELIVAQQQKINELEERIYRLEKTLV